MQTILKPKTRREQVEVEAPAFKLYPLTELDVDKLKQQKARNNNFVSVEDIEGSIQEGFGTLLSLANSAYRDDPTLNPRVKKNMEQTRKAYEEFFTRRVVAEAGYKRTETGDPVLDELQLQDTEEPEWKPRKDPKEDWHEVIHAKRCPRYPETKDKVELLRGMFEDDDLDDMMECEMRIDEAGAYPDLHPVILIKSGIDDQWVKNYRTKTLEHNTLKDLDEKQMRRLKDRIRDILNRKLANEAQLDHETVVVPLDRGQVIGSRNRIWNDGNKMHSACLKCRKITQIIRDTLVRPDLKMWGKTGHLRCEECGSFVLDRIIRLRFKVNLGMVDDSWIWTVEADIGGSRFMDLFLSDNPIIHKAWAKTARTWPTPKWAQTS